MKPRLTFVCSELIIGGAERAWTALLPGLRDRGFPVQVLTLRGEGPFFYELQQRGIDVTCAHMTRRTDIAGLRRALRVVHEGTDLLVSQNVNAQAVGVLLARRAHVPHVTIDQTPPGISMRRYQRLLVRGVARSADLLIGVSSAQLERFRSLGFKDDRIVIIPNAVERLSPTEDRLTTRKRLGADDDEMIVLLVADLRPQKEAHVFTKAVRLAHTADPRIKGFVAGDGPEFPRVAADAAESRGAVTMLGARLDIADLVNAADIVGLSSSSEGLPIALLEAMSLGKPVVATAVAGVTDAVVPDETGLLVPQQDARAFADALLRLARDGDLRQRLGAAGQARQLAFFDAPRMVDSYAHAFESVLAASRPSSKAGGRD
jgi:glycosyltransferase involved in cell wall biosynthesis